MSDTIELFDYIRKFSGRGWGKIIIHHSATRDGTANDWDAIRRWHMGVIGGDANKYTSSPMTDIGYHSGIEMLDGRLVYKNGRSLNNPTGGHTLGQNGEAIGICVVGNFDIVSPTEQHYFLLASLCREYQKKFDIPTENILPHWAFANKTCPGKKFDIIKLRLML